MVSYSKTYEDDIYFFLPMTSSYSEKTKEFLIRDTLNRPYSEDEEYENPTFGEIYCDTLTGHCLYECNSTVFKQLSRIHLGRFTLACYDDNYDGTVYDTEEIDLFVTAHYRTGIYIVTLVCIDNHYIPTQLIDQMSTNHLSIKDPQTGEYVNIGTYMYSHYFLEICGEAKCVICMSKHPDDMTELGYLLAGETSVSEHIDYKILPHRIDDLLKNRAYYDYYDSYISRSVVAFIFKDYSDDIEERLEKEASEIFIVEIVMFQNTAVMRTNNKVINELDENDGITNEEIEELYIEFGRTMKFWRSYVFKYTFAQKEADEIIEAFGIQHTLEEYHRNQEFLDRMVELKSNITDQKSDSRMNNLLFILSCLEGSSISLAGVLWVFNRIMSTSNPLYSFMEGLVSVLWIVSFIAFAIIFLLYTSGKIIPQKKKEKKPKKKKVSDAKLKKL